MRQVAIAVLLAAGVTACSTGGSSDPLAVLCGSEQPEGPGLVNDVEHIPGTNIVVAPPAIAAIERQYEQDTYNLCLRWWGDHHPHQTVP
jgi:hypothetical protein